MSPIVGIGEILWDIYPDGRKVAGGAPFNFAFHCHQLGHEAVIVSRVGDDDLGRELREEVRRLGLIDDFIQIDREHPTGTVMVTLDENKVPTYMITADVAWDYIEWNEHLEKLAGEAARVCYGTLGLRSPVAREAIHRLLEETRRAVLPCVRVLDVNLRPTGPMMETIREAVLAADWLKANDDEFVTVANVFGMTAMNLVRWHWKEVESVWLITGGAEGVEWIAPGGGGRSEGVPASVVDTVGAGDAFTAAMVCLHLEGRALRDCARFANHYAARVCEFQGATPRIDRGEVERAAFGTSS